MTGLYAEGGRVVCVLRTRDLGTDAVAEGGMRRAGVREECERERLTGDGN